MTPLNKELHRTLNKLAITCGYGNDDGATISESGTEAFFPVLYEAVAKVHADWDATVGQSHRDGLCYDVVALLTDALMDVINENDRSGSA